MHAQNTSAYASLSCACAVEEGRALCTQRTYMGAYRSVCFPQEQTGCVTLPCCRSHLIGMLRLDVLRAVSVAHDKDQARSPCRPPYTLHDGKQIRTISCRRWWGALRWRLGHVPVNCRSNGTAEQRYAWVCASRLVIEGLNRVPMLAPTFPALLEHPCTGRY